MQLVKLALVLQHQTNTLIQAARILHKIKKLLSNDREKFTTTTVIVTMIYFLTNNGVS